MKSLVIAAAAVALCAGSFALVHADDMGGMPMPSTQPSTQPTADAKPVNTVCPVSGDPINPKITAVVDGKTVGFCCADCVAEYKKDPAKFAAKLK